MNPDPKMRYGFTFQLGQPSSVILDTPYVDPIVRLGRGSRGSTFVFTRTTDPAAESWKCKSLIFTHTYANYSVY